MNDEINPASAKLQSVHVNIFEVVCDGDGRVRVAFAEKVGKHPETFHSAVSMNRDNARALSALIERLLG